MAILTPPVLQSAHWYTRDGKAMHTIQNADGDGTRPTTLADARKLGLFPSVSSILQLLDKPGLDKWKMEQVALAGLRLKKDKKESEDYYIDRVIVESRKEVEKAGDHGTGVHGEMDRYFSAKLNKTEFAPNAVTYAYTAPAIQWIEARGITPVVSEIVLINHEDGFGGTSDLPFLWQNLTKPGVLDYKTKKTKPDYPIEPFPDQAMQIAAYGKTYWKERFIDCCGINLYMSSTEIGRTEAAAYSPAQLAAEYRIFQMLCNVWRHLNQYDPRAPVDNQPRFFNFKHTIISAVGGVPAAPAAVKSPDLPPVPKPDLSQSNAYSTKTGEKVAPPGPMYPPLPPPLPPEEAKPDFPASGASMAERLVQSPTKDVEVDGIKFMFPFSCRELAASNPKLKTSYAWFYHPATNTGRVSIKGDAALKINGWEEVMPAFAADARDQDRAETSGKGTKAPVIKKDELPKNSKEPKAEKPLQTEKARILEIEAMAITFGKFKTHAKIKKVGDLPPDYLDFLRSVRNVPPHITEYLKYPSIIKRIEREVK